MTLPMLGTDFPAGLTEPECLVPALSIFADGLEVEDGACRIGAMILPNDDEDEAA